MQVTEADAKIWGIRGWFTSAVQEFSEEHGPTPCAGKGSLFGSGIDESPVAMYTASLVCTTGFGGEICPLAKVCASAGYAAKYDGVWGGLRGGVDHVTRPTPATVKRWVQEVVRKAGKNEALLLEMMLHGIPSLGPLLDKEVGKGAGFNEHGCMALHEPNPRLAIQIRRAITRDAIMLGIDAFGMARIELRCGETATCISPWHMLWSSDKDVIPHEVTLEGSRSVAFALFLHHDRGWSMENARRMTKLTVSCIEALHDLAGWIGDEPFVHGNAWDILQWGRSVFPHVETHGHHDKTLIQMVKAAEDLSCSSVAELIEVGRELY